MLIDASRSPQAGNWVQESEGMLLYGTIGHEAYLRPDGTVWYHAAVDWRNDHETYEWHQADDCERWGALVIATRRHPELRELLPRRPNATADCVRCHGTGEVPPKVQCSDCCGLGWVP